MTPGYDILKRDTLPALAARLLPFLATPESRFYDKTELWNAIGGIHGLRQIRKAAAAISLLARRIAEEHPEAQDAAEEIFVSAIYLRWVTLLCIVVEAPICCKIASVPRILAWTIAQHYVDMSVSLEAVESIG